MAIISFNINHRTVTSEILLMHSRHNPKFQHIEKYNVLLCRGEEQDKLKCGASWLIWF